jgi:hypothetical protein
MMLEASQPEEGGGVALGVGAVVGALVGLGVGAVVGALVGLGVGAVVGALVGLGVGATVGGVVGAVVGLVVGVVVGVTVGGTVGAVVGLTVGAGVAVPTGTKKMSSIQRLPALVSSFPMLDWIAIPEICVEASSPKLEIGITTWLHLLAEGATTKFTDFPIGSLETL